MDFIIVTGLSGAGKSFTTPWSTISSPFLKTLSMLKSWKLSMMTKSPR